MRRRAKPSRSGTAVAGGLLGDLVEVFQPSRRHVEAERERVRHDVQLPRSGAPPLHVDLDAGVAYVPAPETSAATRPAGAPQGVGAHADEVAAHPAGAAPPLPRG